MGLLLIRLKIELRTFCSVITLTYTFIRISISEKDKHHLKIILSNLKVSI